MIFKCILFIFASNWTIIVWYSNPPCFQKFEAESLIQDLRQIIEQARGHVTATTNYAQTMIYWHIGERINREVLENQRAEYGKQIVAQLAQQLQEEYGKKGFDKSFRK